MNRVAPWVQFVFLVVIIPVCLGAACQRRVSTTPQFTRLLDPVPHQARIRIALHESAAAVNLDIAGSYVVLTRYSDRRLGSGNGLRAATVRANAGGLQVGATQFAIAALRLRSTSSQPFAVNGKRYRGEIHIERLPDQKLRVINVVALDHYLYGVIGAEMPLSWPEESLKAQAVAARSWATKRILLKKKAAFDVFDDQRSQMYKGIDSESEVSRRVVDATRGLVLAYRGQLITAFFHSYCGGHTEDALRVFGERHLGSLGGVSCPYCRQVRLGDQFTWKRSLSRDELLSALRPKMKARHIDNVRIDKSRSIHADSLVVYHDGQVAKIDAIELRKRLGLRSTGWTDFRATAKGYEVTGVGFGHGVGMCQWGAYGMATLNSNYRDILRFYYPGSQLCKLP